MVTRRSGGLTREEALRILRAHRQELSDRFGVVELALFGSTVRNEARPDSDVDLLVTYDGVKRPWSHTLKAQHYIEDLLGRKVDLIDRPRLRDLVRPYVEREEFSVFEPPRDWRMPVSLPKRWDMYVDDMLDACERVLKFTDGFECAEVLNNDEKYSATLFRLQTVGEAANRISSEVRDAHPEIPWTEIIGARNWIAHGYDAIDPEKFWTMVTISVPELIPQLRVLREEAVNELPAEIRNAMAEDSDA